MHLKKRVVLPLVMMVILGIAFFTVWSQAKPKEDANHYEPVALVNGTPISLKALEREMRKARDGYAMQGVFPDEDQLEALRQETLQRLIETELLWQQSVEEGIVVTEEAVLAELEQMKQQYINEAIFEDVLKSANMTMAELLSLIRKDLAIRAFVEREITVAITVSTDESEIFFQNNPIHFETPAQIRASQICILLEPDASATETKRAQETIEALRLRLQRGESFEALAEEASHCGGIDSGGDLGFFPRGTMDEIIEEAVFALDLHEVSPILKSSGGYHLIKVTDRKPARTIPFEEVKEQIAAHLLDQKTHKAVTSYVDRLRAKAHIEINHQG